jgi:hypothetical protein
MLRPNGEASRFFCPLGFNIKGLFLHSPFRWQTKLNMSFVSSLSGWRWEQKKFLAFVGHSYNLVIHENAVPGSHGKLIIKNLYKRQLLLPCKILCTTLYVKQEFPLSDFHRHDKIRRSEGILRNVQRKLLNFNRFFYIIDHIAWHFYYPAIHRKLWTCSFKETVFTIISALTIIKELVLQTHLTDSWALRESRLKMKECMAYHVMLLGAKVLLISTNLIVTSKLG